MQINPVSQQAAVAAQDTQPTAKPATNQAATQAVAKADTVILSEKAKDLAAKQAGKGAAEEAHESMAAKQKEALNQVSTR